MTTATLQPNPASTGLGFAKLGLALRMEEHRIGEGWMERSIIIVGAGIAGLSAGCYGQMNGYRTQIFEMHTTPGGV
jgi:ribulose 1,5-bisphosphate synthetase/thiazole synthase